MRLVGLISFPKTHVGILSVLRRYCVGAEGYAPC